jgi:hypothetical protein
VLVEAEVSVVLVGEDYVVWLPRCLVVSRYSSDKLDMFADVETRNVNKQYGKYDYMAIFC